MSDDRAGPAPTAIGAGLRPATTAGTFGRLVRVGAELAEVLKRLARRQTSMAPARFWMNEPIATRHPDRLEPWQLVVPRGRVSSRVSMVLDQLEAQGPEHAPCPSP